MSSAEENAYEILGLPQGPAATDNEIKKVSLFIYLEWMAP